VGPRSVRTLPVITLKVCYLENPPPTPQNTLSQILPLYILGLWEGALLGFGNGQMVRKVPLQILQGHCFLMFQNPNHLKAAPLQIPADICTVWSVGGGFRTLHSNPPETSFLNVSESNPPLGDSATDQPKPRTPKIHSVRYPPCIFWGFGRG
jgi:hypothetical protein